MIEKFLLLLENISAKDYRIFKKKIKDYLCCNVNLFPITVRGFCKQSLFTELDLILAAVEVTAHFFLRIKFEDIPGIHINTIFSPPSEPWSLRNQSDICKVRKPDDFIHPQFSRDQLPDTHINLSNGVFILKILLFTEQCKKTLLVQQCLISSAVYRWGPSHTISV